MAILTSDALNAIEKRLHAYKLNPRSAPHGYPMAETTDLLDTIRSLKTLKKRYQRLAERRAQVIAEIFSAASRSISELDDSL